MDSSLRARACAKRRQIPCRKALDRQIEQRLLPFLDPALRIGIYYPVNGEADPFEALRKADPAFLGAPVCLDGERMAFYEPVQLKKGRFGLIEPDIQPASQPVYCDAICVPMCAFSNMHRLGYGKGYYDRYLAAHPNALRIGIAYQDQQMDFPVQPWDAAMDLLITDRKVFVNGSEKTEERIALYEQKRRRPLDRRGWIRVNPSGKKETYECSDKY